MTALGDRLNPKKERDLKVLGDFVSIYCRENHKQEAKTPLVFTDARLQAILGDKDIRLCHDCERLLNHGTAKLLLCTLDPKPMCKKCEIHCYAPGYREQIREVMKFSGLYLIKHGRVDLLAHYVI